MNEGRYPVKLYNLLQEGIRPVGKAPKEMDGAMVNRGYTMEVVERLGHYGNREFINDRVLP